MVLFALAGAYFATQGETPGVLPPQSDVHADDSDSIGIAANGTGFSRVINTEGPKRSPAVLTNFDRPRFELIGTFIAPPMTPSAIIATGKGEALFTPGAAIVGRWRLQRVFPGRIVVRSAESESILLIRAQSPAPRYLDTEAIETSPSQVRVSHAEKLDRYYAGRLPETVAFPGGLQAYGIEEVRDQTYSVDMEALLDQHLQTPLWRQFDYEMDAGGMRLVEIVPGGVVDRFGFVPGDIIAKIDDIPITRIEDLQYLMHPNSNRVRVEFIRASAAMTHTYLLR